MTNGLGSEHESGVQIKFQVKDPQVKYCSIYSENGEEFLRLEIWLAVVIVVIFKLSVLRLVSC